MNILVIRRTNKIISFLLISLVFISLFSFISVSASAKESDGVSLVYRIKLHKIRDDIALHVKQGDVIIEAVGKYNIGRITDVRYESCSAEVFSHRENKNVISEYEGYCDITLTVSADASKGERGYSVNGYALRLGKELAFRLPDFYGVGKCVSITVSEGSQYEADRK